MSPVRVNFRQLMRCRPNLTIAKPATDRGQDGGKIWNHVRACYDAICGRISWVNRQMSDESFVWNAAPV